MNTNTLCLAWFIIKKLPELKDPVMKQEYFLKISGIKTMTFKKVTCKKLSVA